MIKLIVGGVVGWMAADWWFHSYRTDQLPPSVPECLSGCITGPEEPTVDAGQTMDGRFTDNYVIPGAELIVGMGLVHSAATSFGPRRR